MGVPVVSVKKENILRKIYYSSGGPGSYSGIRTMLQQAQKSLPSITQRDVEKFLRNQHTYVRHLPVKKRQKKYIPNILTNTNIEFQCDLAFMKQVKALLVCVDSFSGKLMTQEIHRKTPPIVYRAFLKMVKTQNDDVFPSRVVSDAGTEFKGQFLKGLTEKVVDHRVLRGEHKAPIAERGIPYSYICVSLFVVV